VFYTCLFATAGVDLRAPMRAGASDDAMLELIRNTWLNRGDRYSEQRASLREGEHALRKIEMYYIGG
jgi:cyclic pyranopterin phosphate synthase